MYKVQTFFIHLRLQLLLSEKAYQIKKLKENVLLQFLKKITRIKKHSLVAKTRQKIYKIFVVLYLIF